MFIFHYASGSSGVGGGSGSSISNNNCVLKAATCETCIVFTPLKLSSIALAVDLLVLVSPNGINAVFNLIISILFCK